MKNKAEYQISSSVNDTILEIILTGEILKSAYDTMINKISDVVKENGLKNLLVDIRDLKGRLGIIETYKSVRSYPPHMYTIHFAVVDIPENAGFQSFQETIALYAGLQFKWFTEMDTAKTWLKSK